ncbi:MAG TPA: cupin domain-containing protein [Pontiella sp.]
MNEITIKRNPSEELLNKMGAFTWPIWEKETSEFPWYYDTEETCYLLEGEVVVTPANGEPVRFGAGDLVTFPAGLSCVWKISADVRKHYHFS